MLWAGVEVEVLYLCGDASSGCEVVRPDGSVGGATRFFETEPGTWTFRRGASAEEGAFALFAADARL